MNVCKSSIADRMALQDWDILEGSVFVYTLRPSRISGLRYPTLAICIHFTSNCAKLQLSAVMEIIHTEPRESEEAAEIVRGLGWLLHNDQLEAGSFAGMCETALGAGAQFHRRQFNRTVCVHGEVPVGMIALGIVGPGANAAKFCGRRITPDAIYVLTHGDEGVLLRPQIICSRFPASRTKPLIAHCKHSHKLPSAASRIPAR